MATAGNTVTVLGTGEDSVVVNTGRPCVLRLGGAVRFDLLVAHRPEVARGVTRLWRVWQQLPIDGSVKSKALYYEIVGPGLSLVDRIWPNGGVFEVEGGPGTNDEWLVQLVLYDSAAS
jgi:hypothetical protein